MRKLFYIMIAFSLFHSFAFGQWIQQNSGTTGDLNSVYFVNPMTGWVCGVTGPASTDRIAKTTDGGVTWVRQNAGTYYVLNSIQFINDQTGWAAGIHGTIVKTTNGGTNWYVVFGSTSWDWNNMQFINSQTGWVVSVQVNGIYKTIDGGLNWFYLNYDFSFRSVYFLDLNTGIAISSGVNSRISKTTNGGINWSSILFMNVDFKTVFMFDSLYAWVVGDPSKQAMTINGGILWDTTRITNTLIGPRSIIFLDRYLGYFAGGNGIIYKTSNSGQNWIQQSTGINYFLNDIFFDNYNTGWAVGVNGTILKTTNGGEPVGINVISNNTPKEYNLFQNYPNPFNPSTKIKFNIAKSSFVKIFIYDVSGREISTIGNSFLKSGEYEVEWNASGYSSGIYFYTLETEYFSDTKKLVLIK